MWLCKVIFGNQKSECSSVWLERVIWDHEVVGSSPVIPTVTIG